jgi:hypothetical protein
LKKKFAYLLLFAGFLGPLLSFYFSEPYEGEGAWISRIYEGEVVLQEGVRVKDFRRSGMPAVPQVPVAEVRRNLKRLADPRTPLDEKAELLAGADREFRALPSPERERVLGVLSPGELAGAYVSAAGYRIDQVLESSPYLNKSTIPYRYLLAAGIALILLGAVLLVL